MELPFGIDLIEVYNSISHENRKDQLKVTKFVLDKVWDLKNRTEYLSNKDRIEWIEASERDGGINVNPKGVGAKIFYEFIQQYKFYLKSNS